MTAKELPRYLRRRFRRARRDFKRDNETRLEHAVLMLLGRAAYERLMFKKRVGYAPDLRHPQTYNEKIAWRKLYQKIPDAPMLADKLAVRDFVRQRVGESYLKDVIAVYERAEDIDFDALPDSFAAKGTHGSSFNAFVRDKATEDLEDVRRRLAGFLAITDYGRYKNEWWYAKIAPRILIEPLLVDDRFGVPPDLKVYVYDGKVQMFLVNYYADYAKTQRGLTMYDRDWRDMGASRGYPSATIEWRPKRLEELVEVAETIAGNVDFLRVDFFCPNDEAIVFGEITLAPAAGWLPFNPVSADFEAGSYWRLRPALDIAAPPSTDSSRVDAL